MSDDNRTRLGTLELPNGLQVGLFRINEFSEGQYASGEYHRVLTRASLVTECGQPVIVVDAVRALIVTPLEQIECRLRTGDIRFDPREAIGLESMV